MSDDLRRGRGPGAPRRGLARPGRERRASDARRVAQTPLEPHPSDPAGAASRLAVAVGRTLEQLQARGGSWDPEALRVAVEQLRHLAHETPDAAVRAAVHVACSHLSAGSLDDAREALTTAALRGPRPAPPKR